MEQELISIVRKEDGKLYWKVSKEVTGNDNDDDCGPFSNLDMAISDMEAFLEDSHSFENI